MENIIRDRSFDEERALYGIRNAEIINCRFEGPADGESAMKESRGLKVKDCRFDLRYPFWHDDDVIIENCEMTPQCRAALWYSNKLRITDTVMHGIKALRECSDVKIERCDIVSPEFGWSVRGISMKDSSAEGEYFMMRSDRLSFDNVRLKGKYSFQYITDSVFENCNFDTKDAFWHAKDVVIRNSTIKGEYLAWYCENVTFINCTISGTQPFCYCKNLKLVDCRMFDADLAFEKSEVEANILTPVISIKNPLRGTITVPEVGEIIMDDKKARGEIIIGGQK